MNWPGPVGVVGDLHADQPVGCHRGRAGSAVAGTGAGIDGHARPDHAAAGRVVALRSHRSADHEVGEVNRDPGDPVSEGDLDDVADGVRDASVHRVDPIPALPARVGGDRIAGYPAERDDGEAGLRLDLRDVVGELLQRHVEAGGVERVDRVLRNGRGRCRARGDVGRYAGVSRAHCRYLLRRPDRGRVAAPEAVARAPETRRGESEDLPSRDNDDALAGRVAGLPRGDQRPDEVRLGRERPQARRLTMRRSTG
jgi:hypothetical protein